MAPPAPYNLTAEVTGTNTIALAWQYTGTKGKGFKVQRRLGTSGSWSLLVKLPGLGSTAFTDATVTPCQQYSYRVKTYSSSAASPPSNEVVLTAGTPGAFTLSGVAECSGNNPQNRLQWTASIAATSYDVYRNGALLASGQAGPVYLDSTVTAGQNYLYRVAARNSCGSRDSNEVGVTALSNCCPLPEAFTLTATAHCTGGSPQIGLTWTASTHATSYDVYRNGVSYAPGQVALMYTDSAVTAGTSYNYHVIARNVCGQVQSNTASATAGTPPGSFTLTVTPDCYGSPGVPAFRIKWTAASGVTSVTAYDVYRDGTLLQADRNQTITWYDNTVAAGSTHSYFIRAKNTCGTTDSNTASATAPSSCVFSVITDDQDSGFHIYGPGAWWFEVNNAQCYNNHMWYTPNQQSGVSANYAYWYANLAGGGTGNYAIYAYIPCLSAATSQHADYYVRHGGSTTAIKEINQLAVCSAWALIGTYYCYADGNDHVDLGSTTGEVDLSRNVGFDAIRWEKTP
jgi:hypothetical protein